MKNINIMFDDQDFELLENAKQEQTWREFILTLVKSKGEL